MATSVEQSLRRVARAGANVLDRMTLTAASDRPVFIGGCERSGTTLVRTMLHAHPDLAIPRETRFVLKAWERRTDFGDLRDRTNRARLAHWLVDDRKETQFGRLGVDGDEARQRLSTAPPTLGSVLGTAFSLYADLHEAARWGEKRPLNILKFPIVVALFPDLQFINVVRDPRGVVASMRKLGWLDGRFDGVPGAVMRWRRAVRAGTLARDNYRPDQFLEIQYEYLLDDAERVLRQVCAFTGLGIEHLDAMLKFNELADEIPDPQRRKYFPRLGGPVDQSAASDWAQVLTEEEVAFIERTLARGMARYGYEPVADADAKIGPDLTENWERVVARFADQRLWPRVRSVRYRYPVAARLTTAQKRRARLLLLERN